MIEQLQIWYTHWADRILTAGFLAIICVGLVAMAVENYKYQIDRCRRLRGIRKVRHERLE